MVLLVYILMVATIGVCFDVGVVCADVAASVVLMVELVDVLVTAGCDESLIAASRWSWCMF